MKNPVFAYLETGTKHQLEGKISFVFIKNIPLSSARKRINYFAVLPQKMITSPQTGRNGKPVRRIKRVRPARVQKDGPKIRIFIRFFAVPDVTGSKFKNSGIIWNADFQSSPGPCIPLIQELIPEQNTVCGETDIEIIEAVLRESRFCTSDYGEQNQENCSKFQAQYTVFIWSLHVRKNQVIFLTAKNAKTDRKVTSPAFYGSFLIRFSSYQIEFFHSLSKRIFPISG